LQHVRNITASMQAPGKGFSNHLKEWQKDYISYKNIYIYLYM